MHRPVVLLLLAAVAMPAAAAHSFAELPKTALWGAALDRDNWHEVPVFQQVDPVPDDGLFLLSAAAGFPSGSDATGPASVQISMKALLGGERRVVETWSVPVDGLSRVYATRAVASPNITLSVETLSPADVHTVFIFDYEGGGAVRSVPYWTDVVRSLQLRNANVLYAYHATPAGRLEAVVQEPAVLGLQVKVLRDDGGAWPSGFTEVASSSRASTGGDGAAMHRLSWGGEAGKTYYVQAVATHTYNPRERPAPPDVCLGGGPNPYCPPDQMVASIGPAPHEAPVMAPLALLAVLAVVAVVRRA